MDRVSEEEYREIIEKWKNRASLQQKTAKEEEWRLKELSRSPVIEGLTSPPIVPTNRTPEEIVGDEWLDAYIRYLKDYKKSRMTWSKFAASEGLSSEVRNEFARILQELQEHGFYNPHEENGKLVCYTLIEARKSANWWVHSKGCKCGRCLKGIFTREDNEKARREWEEKHDGR